MTADETVVLKSHLSSISKRKFVPGDLVANRYQIIEKIGGGGMGVVYKVKDIKLKRIIALKFLPPELTHDPEYKLRFTQEAHAASILNHHNICTIHEIDITEDGYLYIAMAYYDGETLKEKIKREPLSLEEAFKITIQVVEGLSVAHKNNIVHRDIKSANVMITKDGIIKILDFGLAKLSGQTRITRTSILLGTVAYMSPEQAQGEVVDFQSDVWSTGVLLYEMLSGQLPFPGEKESAVIYSIVNRSPSPLRELRDDIPWELEKIVLKCLKKDKAKRYKRIEQLLRDLKAYENKLGGKSTVDLGKVTEIRRETERRHVTVMFVKLSGYIEMLQTMSEEEVASIMLRFNKIFGTIEKTYDVRIEKITERSFKVFFGLPVVIEKAPYKALNSAFALRNQLYELNKQENLQVPLDIHIGINTGTVIFGEKEEKTAGDYEITGGTLDLASKLMEISPKGKIYVGPTTYRYTKQSYDFEHVKSITIKGEKESSPVFEALSQRRKIPLKRKGLDRMIYSEMVGRDKELDKLEYHLLKVINGEGSIVNIVGEAGIGKSRLLDEFKKKEAIKKVTLLEGRALSIGKNLSFHPIIELFKRWAGIREEDGSTSAYDKLNIAINDVCPNGANETLPFIATLMGMKLSGLAADRIRGIEGEGLEKLILKNTKELFIKIAEKTPLVFIIEDLHWADLTSIDLLESLFRLAERNPILYINLFRPHFEETSERVLDTVRERHENVYSEIKLESLAENQAFTLINNLLKTKTFPAAIRNLINEKSEGNPFFIEEVLRSFIDEGIVEYSEEGFQFTKNIYSAYVPETINEVLMARIDKLDEKTKSLLKVASVIGRHFFYKIIVKVVQPVEGIDEILEFLKEVQLIRERRIMDELEYIFKHALVQEVTYDSILLDQRKKLHLKVANSIESVFSKKLPEFYGKLAFHYSLGGDIEKAEHFLIMAGEEALKAAASSEALSYYQEALNLYIQKHKDSADSDKLAKLENNIATALFNKGRMNEAVDHFDSVLKYWGEKTPVNRLSEIMNLLMNMLNMIKNLYFPEMKRKRDPTKRDNERILLGEKKGLALTSVDHYKMFMDSVGLLKILNRLDLTKVEKGVSIYSGMSALFSYTGISFKISSKILSYAKKYLNPKDSKSLFNYRFYKLTHDFPSGNWEKDLDYDESFVNLNIKKGEVFVAAGFSLWSGLLILEQGNFLTAQRCINKLDEIGEVYENDYARARKFIVNTKMLFKQRKIHEAIKEADNGITFLKKSGQALVTFTILGIKANIQLLFEDFKGADISLSQCRDLSSQERRISPFFMSGFLMGQFKRDVYLLEKAMQSNDFSEIKQLRKKSLISGKAAIKNSIKYASDKTEVFRLMGLYYWHLNKKDKALKWWQKSVHIGAELNARPELARTYFEIGNRLNTELDAPKQLNGVTAKEYIEKAHHLFQAMELDWDLRDVGKISNV